MTAAQHKLSTFPAFFRVSGRTVVVVGGGDEAFAKARLLFNTDARIVVLAEEPEADFARFIAEKGLVLQRVPFSTEAIAGATLVFAATGNAAPIEALESPVVSAARLIAAQRTESDTPDLATAQIVVGGGVALGSAENFQLIERLAKRLGAAIGATRAAVDAGYAPNDWQVGQTGKIIAPDLYIAIGISGALQHLAGIQGARKVIAINTDPEAPLVKLADVALIGDLFDVVPQLLAALERLGVASLPLEGRD